MKPISLAVRKFERSSAFYLRAFLTALILLAVSVLSPGRVRATSILVPQNYPTIQAAINASQNGDVIIVSPGTYNEALTISGKTITLASEFYLTSDPARIDQTIIDGGGSSVITVSATAGAETQIIGFTIQNGVDGISTKAKINVLNNRIVNTTDGFDSVNGGGLIKNNIFENNQDDGVDFNRASSGTIQDNIIRNNGNDGIEIRLHDYIGPTLTVAIRGNVIEGNLEDGIQLIDYPSLTNRVYTIERNLIRGNKMVGIGLMDNGVTNEDFRAASIPERIHVFNNTIIEQPYSITGGDNLIALNNIFANSATLALKNVDNQSIAAYNLFGNNAVDYQGSNIDGSTTLYGDPFLDANGGLSSVSPAINAGTALFVWNGETVLSYPPDSYTGAAPDLGWRESSYEAPLPTPTPGPQPITLSFNPVDDATVSNKAPNKNFGSITSLTIDNSPIKYVFIKFNVSGINGRHIRSAKLRLYNIDASNIGGELQAVADNNWSESTITWNNAPANSSQTIASLGKVVANSWYELDVTSLVTGDGTFSFRITTPSTNSAGYYSREGAAGFTPQLVVSADP